MLGKCYYQVIYHPSKINSQPACVKHNIMSILIRNLVKSLKIGFLLLDILIQLGKVVELQPVGNNANLNIIDILAKEWISQIATWLWLKIAISPSFDKNNWWMKHETELLNWSQVYKMFYWFSHPQLWQNKLLFFCFFLTVLLNGKGPH